MAETRVRVMVIYYREDDPRKNTSMKMIRFGKASRINPRMIRGEPVVLNPYSNEYIGPWLRGEAERYGLVVVDASWKKLSPEKFRGVRGKHCKLPPLLPGNPVNYGKPCILSSIEAVAATLYIINHLEEYRELLKLYKWMNTFHTLNNEVLEAYREAENPEKLWEKIVEYWGEKPPC